MIETLKYHASKYKEMMPQDAVKLIYQNEFGGGHLINDKELFIKRLLSEYQSIEKDINALKFEDIGNNIIRVNLKALSEDELLNLNEVFIKSANLHKGSLLAFKYKLKLLLDNFYSIGFNFSLDDLLEYLEKYKKSGYPMVSHSKVYNEKYKPAYRIILKELYYAVQNQKPD